MLYHFDMVRDEISGMWIYENDMFDSDSVRCFSMSSHEKLNMLALGGRAAERDSYSVLPFLSLHHVGKGKYPAMATRVIHTFQEAVKQVLFMPNHHNPTVVACDAKNFALLQLTSSGLEIISCVALHQSTSFLTFRRHHQSDVHLH